MELKQIKELMAAMERAGIKKVSIKEKDGFEVQLERHEEAVNHPISTQQTVFHPVYHPPFETQHRFPSVSGQHQQHPSFTEEKPVTREEVKDVGKSISSPMVGTFYLAASPEDPVFVKVGDKVDENTVVCIIEAMKVMNEVKAGMSGIVVEICVDNAHPVEFGTRLFRIQ
ncbi:MAG: acetyl-CoA carboxylase biotin carboxyl carrier protein [Simkania sp.]|nr:acetyl-CoA carboxylase biotin carboxyl carrier protein [Simkania sp.]